MRVKSAEIEFASDEEDHRTHRVDVGVAARTALGSLKQAIECFEKAIGLPGLRPSHDAFEMGADHPSDLFHRLDLGAQHIGTPLPKQGRNNIDLFAVENLAQLFAVQPCFGSALGGDMSDQRIQIGGLTGRQLASVLEQCPAQPLQRGIGLLLGTAHLVHGGRGMGNDMELVERDAGIGQVIGDTFDEGGRHVDAGRIDLAGIAAMGDQILSKRFDRLGIAPFGDEHHLARFGIR